MLKIFIISIQFYQRWFSCAQPARCRFVPTCSSYSLEAIERHGYYGLWLSLKRIAGCHPWGKHGVDEVPSPSNTKVGKNG